MKLLTSRQSGELFHLIFLDYSGRKLDKQKWALTGGGNLRFFFKSPRYSDGLDLAVRDVSVNILHEKVNSILFGKPFKTILEVRDITIEHVTKPNKQKQPKDGNLGC